MTIPELIGVVSVGIWLYLLLGRGQFWRVSDDVAASAPLPSNPPRVAVVVPARNEAAVIAQSVTSLLLQDYPGDLRIILVDDDSADDTANIAVSAASHMGKRDRLTIVHSASLPPGWTGKLWAVGQGVQGAAAFGPEWFWFTDADVIHAAQSLRALLGKACAGNFDLVSFMVKLRCESWAERALIPAFVFFFFKLYPPKWVASTRHRTAAAAGGCILVRATTLSRIGGIASIRTQLIDDCALARQVKSVGHTWIGLSSGSQSIRAYGHWTDVGRMISRSAFTQLRHSTLLLLATLAALAITYLAPPILLFCGSWALGLGILAWILMSIAFLPMLRFYGQSPLWAPLLPLSAAFYAAATVHSALQYWMDRGGQWKGRVQDPLA